MVTASGQSPAVGHTASRGGGRAQPPHTHRTSARRARPGPRGPEVSSETWEATPTGGPGRGLSSGTSSENTAVAVTACPALTLCQAARHARPSPGPSAAEVALGPFYRRGNGGSGCTSPIPALFLPCPPHPPELRLWGRAMASAPRFRRTAPPLGGTAGRATSRTSLGRGGKGQSKTRTGAARARAPSRPVLLPCSRGTFRPPPVARPGCSSRLRGPRNDIREPLHCSSASGNTAFQGPPGWRPGTGWP